MELCSLSAIALGLNYDGGNEDNGDLPQKIPCVYCYTQCPQPCSRPPPTHASAETPGHSWASLGQSLVESLLLSLGSWCTKVLFVPSKSLFPPSCVSSGSSGGVNGALLQEAYAILKSAAHTAPTPEAVHCWPVPLQETPKHSSVSVSVGSLGPGALKVCLTLFTSLVKWGLILNTMHPSYYLAEGYGNRLQYSCLENPMVGAW